MIEQEGKDIGLTALDVTVTAVSTLTPITATMGALVSVAAHGIDVVKGAFDQFQMRKIDRFIFGVNRNERSAEKFKLLLFSENRKEEYALRILHDVFRMETERKVDYFSEAALAFADGKVEETDFFRIGMILAITLAEDLEFLHSCDLTKKYSYSSQVQGLMNVGLMSEYDGGNAYKFTPFAQTIDMFALDYGCGEKYGFDYSKVEALENPYSGPVWHNFPEEDAD